MMETLAIILSFIVIASSAIGILFTLRTRRIMRAMTATDAASNPIHIPGLPAGCLCCNADPVAAWLRSHGISPDQFVAIPTPRHAWADITRCPDCGSCFLVNKETN